MDLPSLVNTPSLILSVFPLDRPTNLYNVRNNLFISVYFMHFYTHYELFLNHPHLQYVRRRSLFKHHYYYCVCCFDIKNCGGNQPHIYTYIDAFIQGHLLTLYERGRASCIAVDRHVHFLLLFKYSLIKCCIRIFLFINPKFYSLSLSLSFSLCLSL